MLNEVCYFYTIIPPHNAFLFALTSEHSLILINLEKTRNVKEKQKAKKNNKAWVPKNIIAIK